MLEFGNGHGSLRENLRTAGGLGSTPKTTPTPSVQPATLPPATTLPRAPEHKPAPSFQVITLAAGETLYGLCQRHLGEGQRWKEVAALNGWSQARVAKLPAGQEVKLPVR